MNREQILAEAKQLAQANPSSFVMGTVSEKGTPHVFYMGALVLEEPFTLYMETYSGSHKVEHIRHNPSVEIVLAKPDYSTVVTISGTAALDDSPQKKRMVFDKVPASKQYFTGPDAPEFAVIRLQVKHIEVQHSSEGPMVRHDIDL